MSFYEDLAAALDKQGIESRIHQDILFVPVAGNIDIEIEVANEVLPAANIFIGASLGETADAYRELVMVAFSIEAAVEAIADHLATAAIIEFTADLVEDPQSRYIDYTFDLDPSSDGDLSSVLSPLGKSSSLVIDFSVQEDHKALASLTFVTRNPDVDALVKGMATDMEQLYEDIDPLVFREMMESSSEINRLIECATEDLLLGQFTDFARVQAILPFIASHAEEWEKQIMPTMDFLEEDEEEDDDFSYPFGFDDDDEDDFYYSDDDDDDDEFDDDDDDEFDDDDDDEFDDDDED